MKTQRSLIVLTLLNVVLFFCLAAKPAPEPQVTVQAVVRARAIELLQFLPLLGWVLVGDAFGFVDPMLSPGVFLVLRSAVLVAQALTPVLERRTPASPRTPHS